MLMSSSFDLSSTSLVFLGVLTFLIRATKADPIYLYHFCTNTSTYSPNSTFQTNLNSLLSSLSSNVVSRRNGFYNTTAGRSSPDVAYGLFLCRGDVSADVCQDCVTTATSESVRRCTKEREVVIWYDECMLRYSNRSFFSIVTEVPAISMLNSGNITEQSRFNQLLGETMNDLSRRVASGESFTPAEKFGVEQANFTAIQTLFTLAQCTPDLSESSCTRCLTGAIAGIGNCCYGKQGGRVLLPSCNVRYELYQFYNTAAIALSSPAPSPSSLVPPPSRGKDVSSQKIIAIVVPVGVSVALACAICLFFLRRKVKTKYNPVNEQNVENDITAVQSLQYDLNTIQAATNNFSAANKIGAGGFGDVYKGILSNGQEIAVKRSSRGSGQGAEEFKNEVILVAKLQHRNLARILGFCLDGEEKILIYEFVPNKSLDYFLFDPEKRRLLDWSKRYKIIQGIVRGILYLHEDARLRIVHRDLKASNVLLDGDMHPKISDFGMARIFGVDQTQANTNRVVGTYGYMSPEYAMHGQFSVKSDVYSFGVLVLEIISGQRSTRFHQSNGAEDLVNYAWRKWREGTPLELMDPNLGDSYSRNEVLRCIHVGLLCVQEDPVDRPTMASIALVLNTFSVTLPLPREPSIFGHNKKELNPPLKGVALDQSTSSSMPGSVNEATITELHPR